WGNRWGILRGRVISSVREAVPEQNRKQSDASFTQIPLSPLFCGESNETPGTGRDIAGHLSRTRVGQDGTHPYRVSRLSRCPCPSDVLSRCHPNQIAAAARFATDEMRTAGGL